MKESMSSPSSRVIPSCLRAARVKPGPLALAADLGVCMPLSKELARPEDPDESEAMLVFKLLRERVSSQSPERGNVAEDAADVEEDIALLLDSRA